jgi:hypothetical protein
MTLLRSVRWLALAATLLLAGSAHAADYTARELTKALFGAHTGATPD